MNEQQITEAHQVKLVRARALINSLKGKMDFQISNLNMQMSSNEASIEDLEDTLGKISDFTNKIKLVSDLFFKPLEEAQQKQESK